MMASQKLPKGGIAIRSPASWRIFAPAAYHLDGPSRKNTLLLAPQGFCSILPCGGHFRWADSEIIPPPAKTKKAEGIRLRLFFGSVTFP
jgi:hypothetical protein